MPASAKPDVARAWSDLSRPILDAINVELSSFCNRNCFYCLNSRFPAYRKGFMSDMLIDRLVEEVDSSVKIVLCGFGEPSLHPFFPDILRRLCRHFPRLSVVTNGHLFEDSDLLRRTLASGIPKINLSLDYIEPERYRHAKKAELSSVLDGIRRFVDLRNRSRSRTFLQINYLIEVGKSDYLYAFHLLDKIISEYWCMYLTCMKNLAGQVKVITPNKAMLPDFPPEAIASQKVLIEDWEQYLANTNFVRDRPKICRHLYRYFVLRHNGDVVPCFFDQLSTMVVCNVTSDRMNLAQVLQCEKYHELRCRQAHQDLSLCTDCTDHYKYT